MLVRMHVLGDGRRNGVNKSIDLGFCCIPTKGKTHRCVRLIRSTAHGHHHRGRGWLGR